MRFFSFIAALVALPGTATALSGEATFYGGNTQGGMCSFSTYTIPNSIYGTALSDSNWAGSEACGACVKVSYGGKSLTAMVVDQCPGCGTNHLDLFPSAFTHLAAASQGIIGVTWDYVDCPITSPLQIHMKEGVSANWFSAQVVNANKRVADMQVSTDGGRTWKSGLTRQPYNFFEYSSGFGTTSVSVRVESIDGHRVTVSGVSVTSGKLTVASGNF